MNYLEMWHRNSIRMEAAMKCVEPPSTTDEIMDLGYPSNENILERHGYVISYDYGRRMAKWVSECLTPGHVLNPPLSRAKTRGIIDFEEDADIDSSRRATLADYTDWPKDEYQKGHLAAAGNHRYNFEAYSNTFYLSNIVPMCPNVNKIIGDIEKKVRKFALKHGKVYIITGPYFHRKWFVKFFKRVPNFVINGSKVQVPDGIFKVVVFKETLEPYNYKVLTYFVENVPNGILISMGKTKISLAELKQKTGLNLLSEVPLNLIEENILAHIKPQTDLNILCEADNHTVDVDNHAVDIDNHAVDVDNHAVDVDNHAVDVGNHALDVCNHAVDVDNLAVDADNHAVDGCSNKRRSRNIGS